MMYAGIVNCSDASIGVLNGTSAIQTTAASATNDTSPSHAFSGKP